MTEKKVEPMIAVDNLCKWYNDITALDNVSFSVMPGEFVSLVGPSGAGKSTLVRMLICEEKPTRGKIYIAGRDITSLDNNELPYYRRKVGVVFQDYKLLPQKTVAENVAYALEVSDATNEEIEYKVPKILEMVGLTSRAKNYPRELSGGEQQRASIARALVNAPSILIADEPTGNLDPKHTIEIIKLLLKINEKGTVVILATHNKSVVDQLNKRVIAMKAGKIISDRAKGGYNL